MAVLNIKQKKEWAQMLFISGDYSQKEISNKTGVSERSISKWVREEAWESRRRSLLSTKSKELSRLYTQLEKLNDHIEKRSKDEEGKGYADSKEADTITKLTSAIRNLETETSIGEMIETAKKLILFIQNQGNLPDAPLIAEHFDMFIKDRLKTF